MTGKYKAGEVYAGVRGLFLVFLFLISSFPLLASHIISDGSLPEDALMSLSEVVGRDTHGRGDLILNARSYSETRLDDGSSEASFMLSFGEKEILVEFYGSTRKELLSSLSGSVHNILFYEPALYSGAELELSYILDGTYSVLAAEPLRPGTRLSAYDSFGNTRARFEVDESYDGAFTLDPFYINRPYPGMRLEKSGAWKIVGSLSSGFNFASPEVFAMISLGRSDLIYPFVPILSVAYRYGGGQNTVYGGVGLEAYMNLSRIFPSWQFTLIEEGRIGGSVSLLVGTGSGGFDWRSVFSIFYEHHALPSFFWRFGYQNLQGKHALTIGFGGDF